MIIIPALNCKDLNELISQLIVSRSLFHQEFSVDSGWVQIDVTDGVFSSHPTWHNPGDLAVLMEQFPDLKKEVHLMVNEPERALSLYLDSGIDRIVVHGEAVRDLASFDALLLKYATKISVSLGKNTQKSAVLNYSKYTNNFQLLAVPPGSAGQAQDHDVLIRLQALRSWSPDCFIEIDGGINKKNILQLKNGGADAVAVASAIFNTPDPELSYRELLNIIG